MLSDLSNKILLEANKFAPKDLYKVPEIEGYSHDQVVREIYLLEKDGYLDALPSYTQENLYPIAFQNIKITRKGLDFLNTPMGQSTQQQKILILTAIPHGLRLDKETQKIKDAIRRATRRDLFDIRTQTAVRPEHIRRAIAEERPQIVHFCGHGLEDGSLLLEDEEGKDKPVSPEALVSLFNLHINYVQCVLLNACYSEKAAMEISQCIDYVIGMNNPIQDGAAIAFAQGFYDGLGYKISDNQDVFQRAFDEAMVAVKMENLSQSKIPVLKKKKINQLWQKLINKSDEKAGDFIKVIHNPRVSGGIVGKAINTLPTQKIRLNSDFIIQISLESKNRYLILLNQDVDGKIFCICPSFGFAHNWELSRKNINLFMEIPQCPDYPTTWETMKCEKLGTEHFIAILTEQPLDKEAKDLEWLKPSRDEPIPSLDKDERLINLYNSLEKQKKWKVYYQRLNVVK